VLGASIKLALRIELVNFNHIGMGKKKIIAQSEQDILREEQELSAAQKKAASGAQSFKSKRVEKAKAFIRSSYNNTILTLTDMGGDVLASASSGALGFKGPKKATPFAASKVVEAVIEKVRKLGVREVIVYVRGIGSGREAAIRALASHGLEISTIKDVTPIPHNGCRPRKVRRV
jgi:small subunit ribosomal protein S11